MKKVQFEILLLLILYALLFLYCKREVSCEGCKDGNKPPIAAAGPDQVITLPTDSISLDGSSSSDADGKISEWLWKKISGPASYNIVTATSIKSVVKSLDSGIYKFELLVKDEGGLSASDTIQITVNPATAPANRPPFANAGIDQTITLPVNSVNLDGSASNDPDTNITNYLWTKILGPSSFNIATANVVQTQVVNLVAGVYRFELKVTDAAGLFSKDTVQVTVISPLLDTCAPNRSTNTLGLTVVGNIPNVTGGSVMISTDNKIFFAGGENGGNTFSKVDIFNLTTQTWSTTNLSLPRTSISAAACANKVFFAGGFTSSGPSSRVDIYDIATQSWTTAELSEPRIRIATATIGDKVLFAGGCSNTPYLWSGVSNKIDIYDLSTNTWSVKILSETKIGFTATTVGNKVFFAGGWKTGPLATTSTSANIDIYDDLTGIWTTSTLNVAKGFHSSVYKNGKIYWGGGGTDIDEPWVGNNVFTCQVEIFDINNQATSFANLSKPCAWYYWEEAFVKDDKIGFLNYDNSSSVYYFDIYNTTTNTWSVSLFGVPTAISTFYKVISENDSIYLIGGGHIWKVDF